MRSERVVMVWSAGGLAGSLLAAAVWAQEPVPPTGPAPAIVRPSEGGPIHRAFHRVGRKLQDNFVGYPQEFVEPPPGYFISETFGTMKGKANVHRFMLYRSDFLDGSDQFSPNGAARFNLMASRLDGWLGPVVIEWSPDQPGLAEARRIAVLTTLQSTGLPLPPERVVVGPSPYPGKPGTIAESNYNVMITRAQAVPAAYPIAPTSSAPSGGPR